MSTLVMTAGSRTLRDSKILIQEHRSNPCLASNVAIMIGEPLRRKWSATLVTSQEQSVVLVPLLYPNCRESDASCSPQMSRMT